MLQSMGSQRTRHTEQLNRTGRLYERTLFRLMSETVIENKTESLAALHAIDLPEVMALVHMPGSLTDS